ncbi:MAG: tRNA-dihydrouridine synthase family protein [Candidatus Pacearchaeota archaeon]
MTKFPKLSSKILLAPMHSVTNVAFRLMCKKYGAGLVVTQLLSADAIAVKNKETLLLAKTTEKEKPVAIQFFSDNVDNIVKSAKLMQKDFDIIDINLGCPSETALKQGSGGALLKDKSKIFEIISKTSSSINKPLTVKIRSGFENSSDTIEIAKLCEKAGASAIIIHPRTVKQGYSGKADWDLIKRIKQSVKIPVIGNGDVVDGKTAKKMFKTTGCDYVMIGRAAIGNPFIFKQINEYLNNGKIITQTKQERIKDYFEYIELAKKYDVFSIRDAKQKAVEFTSGFDGSKKLRLKLNTNLSWEEIEKLVIRF